MHSILRGGQQNSKKLCARFSSVAKKKPLLELIATSQRGSDSASSAAGSQLQVAQNPDLFAVKDPVYPLPGRSATDLSFYRGKSPPAVPAAASDSGRTEPERSMHEHQFLTLKNLEYYREVRTMASFPSLSPNDRLDFAVHNCPQALKNDFASLFPGVDVKKSALTVITLAKKTETDQAAWATEVEVERESLTVEFIRTAESICESLKAAGYWADFIDPSSGRPYLGPFTNSTFFETDERYRNFGFRVEDLGCCKVIEHIRWGTHAFIGSIFTSAPRDCELLANAVKIN